MKLLCIDSNSILNRAFYGIKLLSTKEGVYTNAVFGYMNIFKKLLDEVAPDAVACAFDLAAPTFRHQRYAGYKAQRKGMPAELAMQLPLVKELLALLGYRIVETEGFEADDILGTFARLCREQGQQCVIATGDRDSLQLVSEETTVLLASTKMGKPATTVCTPDYIKETYGVTPAQLIEVKALMGDTSDNIPGVAGVGEKGALRLIAQYGTIEALYRQLEALPLAPGLKQKLAAGRESAFMSRELAEICCRAPVDPELGHYRPATPDYGAARALLARLQMFSLIDRLGIPAGAEPPAEAAPQEAPAPQKAAALGDAAALEALLAGGGTLDLLALTAAAARGPKAPRGAKPQEPEAFVPPDAGPEQLCGFAVDTPAKVWCFTAAVEGFPALLRRALACENNKRVGEGKLLHRFALEQGFALKNVAFDAELAGYLLSPNSSEYTVRRLAEEYSLPAPQLALPAGVREDGPLAAFIQDAARLGALCDVLGAAVERDGLHEVLNTIELPLSQVLAAMELAGFRVDPAGIEQFGLELDGSLRELEEQITRYAGGPFNINSPKQLGEVLFQKLGLPSRRKTKSGYSTDAEVLESLAEYHPIVPAILEYRKLIKLKSTYVEGLIKVVGADGRIHSVFKQTETRTGRISSTEPNMQNIPVRTPLGSRLRKYFIAAPGCLLVDADYSQIELRVLAHIAQDENMLEAFRTGQDIHTQTAAQVFDMPPLFVTPEMRSRAKAVNFGIVYGIGAFSLSKDIGVSVKEADSYIKNYLNTFSGVKRYMEETVERAKEKGYVTTILGRRRYLPELRSTNKNMQAFGRRVAMNTPIQGTAADIIKLAMIRVYRRLAAEGLRARLILQVHDELIVEAPREEAARVGEILVDEMEHAVSLSVQLKVDLNMGESWYDAK